MINAKEKPAQDALNAKLQEASSKLDSVLAGMTGADAKAAADFKALWEQFKATRDNQIIPAIYKGNAAEAVLQSKMNCAAPWARRRSRPPCPKTLAYSWRT
jgi:hypothetical protein